MNYQDYQGSQNTRQNGSCIRCVCGCCGGSALGFLVLLFALGLGLILGAIYVETIFPAIAAVVAFTAAVAAAIVAILIYCWCRRSD